MEKRSNFSSFPQYFRYISNFKSPDIFVRCGCFFFFLNSANLICRGTDISKYFIESLGIRDNKSQLYITLESNEHTHKTENGDTLLGQISFLGLISDPLVNV